jgi:hypothetical protein
MTTSNCLNPRYRRITLPSRLFLLHITQGHDDRNSVGLCENEAELGVDWGDEGV